ncbi:MAG TPA: hypothetical protein VKU42_13365 [Candidatus Angelobacter sp.]|nr:hypothetical protein [Candidatus Angelobacter sp.]
MSQQKWERDILNRQRNIVFPDTVLNEGRFYRNIASGKAVFSTGQKVSLMLIAAFFVVVNTVAFASNFGIFLSGDKIDFRAWDIEPLIISSVWMLFWLFLTMKALFPPEPPGRKRRRGYRSSSASRS